MKRSLYGHTIVAVIVAIAAYVAWTKPKTTTEESTVTIVDGSPERLTSVRYQEERWNVAVNRTGDEDFAVTVQRLHPAPKKPKKKLDEAEPDGDEAEPDEAEPDEAEPDEAEPDEAEPDEAEPDEQKPEPPDPPKTFPGSQKVAELIEKLAPLQAARSLGELGGDRLASMGLDEPKSKLTLVFGGEEHIIELGNSTYGSGDIYARTGDGEIFLLSSATIGTIRHGASSLLDKNAVGIAREKVTRLTISAGAQGREIAQRYPEDEDKRFFSDPAEPETKLEMVSNWLDRMWRLRVISLLDASEAPPSMMPPAVEVEMFAGPESLGVVRLWDPDERVARATSTRFEQPFTVSKASADALLKDVEGILNEGR